jgi:hypothetical protein
MCRRGGYETVDVLRIRVRKSSAQEKEVEKSQFLKIYVDSWRAAF